MTAPQMSPHFSKKAKITVLPKEEAISFISGYILHNKLNNVPTVKQARNIIYLINKNSTFCQLLLNKLSQDKTCHVQLTIKVHNSLKETKTGEKEHNPELYLVSNHLVIRKVVFFRNILINTDLTSFNNHSDSFFLKEYIWKGVN